MEENYLKGNQLMDNSNLLFMNLGGGRRLCDAQIIVEGENAVANGHLNVSLSKYFKCSGRAQRISL